MPTPEASPAALGPAEHRNTRSVSPEAGPLTDISCPGRSTGASRSTSGLAEHRAGASKMPALRLMLRLMLRHPPGPGVAGELRSCQHFRGNLDPSGKGRERPPRLHSIPCATAPTPSVCHRLA